MNSKEVKKGGLKYCPKCGAPIKEGSVFCEKCGFDLSKREVKEKKAPKEGLRINPKMIAGIVIIAVVAVGGIYITFSGKGGITVTETPIQKPVGTVTQTTTPPLTTTPTTASPTTTPPTTTSPPTTTPAPTTPPPTTPAPTHTTLTGGMNEPLDDGKLYVVVWTVTKSYRGWQPGGYFVEVFIQNLTKDKILWKPKVMKVIDSSGKSHNCRVDLSFILTGTEEQLSVIEQVFDPDEGFRLWLNFETGMYLPKTFILTNEYGDGSTTTWEIRLKL